MTDAKPLRNYLRKFNLRSMLNAIWHLSTHLEYRSELPPHFREANPLRKRPMQLGFFLWELDTLSREAILHCDIERGLAVTDWSQVRNAINLIKAAEDAGLLEGKFSLLEKIGRLAHRQFHWQKGISHQHISRMRQMYLKPEMNDVVRHVYGLSTDQVAMVGFAALATYMTHFGISHKWLASAERIVGVNPSGFLSNLTTNYESLRNSAVAARALDENWAYTFNPLWLHPIIEIDSGARLICPIPGLLARRFTDGLYFDVVGQDNDILSRQLGPAFQSYVGETAARANAGSFQIYSEVRYGTKGKPKDSVDWIIEDASAALFVEVKLLKMAKAAKEFLAPEAAVMKELKKLAKAVGQLYAAISDARQGSYPHWTYGGQAIYPMIATLDDWSLFHHQDGGEINNLVRQELVERGLDPSLVDTNRYLVCSADEFEIVIQVMHSVGIDKFMSGITKGDKVGWLIDGYVRDEFRNELNHVKPLFPNDMLSLLAKP